MSKLSTLTRNFDPIKTLLFFLIFILISLLLVFVLIVPSMREFKSTKTDFYRHDLQNVRLHEELAKNEKRIAELEKLHANEFRNLSLNFDREKFLSYAKEFFTKVNLSSISSKNTNDQDVAYYELNVSSSIKSPTNFYNFLDGLKNYPNVIKADFPILMHSDGENINASFNIKVYKDNR